MLGALVCYWARLSNTVKDNADHSQATLVSVKTGYDSDEILAGINLILDDIRARPGREHRSVVVVSGGWYEPDKKTYEKVKNDHGLQVMYGNDIRALLELGVPIVCATGNDAQKPGRETIDSLPALFADETTPIINVGAVDSNGERAPFSQGGGQVTIYAPGVDIEILYKYDDQQKIEFGTSLGKRSLIFSCLLQSSQATEYGHLLTLYAQPHPKSPASLQPTSPTRPSPGTTPSKASSA
jgi:hypothetical protein